MGSSQSSRPQAAASKSAPAAAPAAFKETARTAADTIDAEEAIRRVTRTCSVFSEDDVRAAWRDFVVVDANGDGSLSAEEVQLIARVPDLATARKAIAVFDTDGDGQISFAEWVGLLEFLSPRATFEQRCKLFIALFDSDRDGKIQLREWEAFVRRMWPELPEDKQKEYAAKSFAVDDIDGDGELTLSEMIEHRESVEGMFSSLKTMFPF